MRRKIAGLLAVLALVTAACTTESNEQEPLPKQGSGEPLIQITSEGGFVPVEVALGTGPRYTLLDDGTLIHQGVSAAIFPSPIFQPAMVVQLDADQMGDIRSLIETMGLADLDDEVDNSQNQFVADASTEVIKYWDESGAHRLAVYALGIEQNPSERNQAFLDLIDYIDRAATSSESVEPYDNQQLRVVAGPGFVDPEFQDVRDWPFGEEDFSTWSEFPNGWFCKVMGNTDVFDDASTATQWRHPDPSVAAEPLTLLVRPVYPGETPCP